MQSSSYVEMFGLESVEQNMSTTAHETVGDLIVGLYL